MPKPVILFSIIFLLLFFGNNTAYSQRLQVAPNDRYLVKSDGSPFFWMGDTAWELIHQLDSGEVMKYLRDRKAKGFNVFQTVIVPEFDGLRSPNRYGEVPFIDQDPTKPNEQYFQYVDYIVKAAADIGMYVALEPTWAIHVIYLPWLDNLHVFTVENARTYGEFLGERYKDQWNVVWLLGGDTNPSEEGRVDIWESLAKGLKAKVPDILITFQPTGFNSSADYIHDKDWLDFNGAQVGHRRRNNRDAEFMQAAWDKKPIKPVLNVESTYEGIPVGFREHNGYFGAFDVRKAAYWSVFNGSLGFTYGHNAIWMMYSEGEPKRYGVRTTWDKALDAPGGNQMQYLHRLMVSRPQLSRVPENELLQHPGGAEPTLGFDSDKKFALYDGSGLDKKDATYLMAYLTNTSGTQLNTSVIKGEQLNVWLYSPRNGRAYFIGKFKNEGAFKIDPSHYIKNPEEGPDWVLVIDNMDANYAPPGE